jgi:hypothetical protein
MDLSLGLSDLSQGLIGLSGAINVKAFLFLPTNCKVISFFIEDE